MMMELPSLKITVTTHHTSFRINPECMHFRDLLGMGGGVGWRFSTLDYSHAYSSVHVCACARASVGWMLASLLFNIVLFDSHLPSFKHSTDDAYYISYRHNYDAQTDITHT
jgi:hypothetical protein